MRRVLVERGVPDAKIHDTPNGIDDRHLSPDATPSDAGRAALGLPTGRLFMYAGNLGELQGLDTVVRAFAARPAAHLVVVGHGVASGRLTTLATSLGAANIHFRGQVSLGEVGALIAQSDAQIVSLQDTPLLRVTMPSKVQTSLAAGRAVLAHVAGDAANLITSNRVGWAATPGDEDSLGAAIDAALAAPESMVREMGTRARRVYEDNFSETAGATRLAAALHDTMTYNGGHP